MTSTLHKHMEKNILYPHTSLLDERYNWFTNVFYTAYRVKTTSKCNNNNNNNNIITKDDEQ